MDKTKEEGTCEAALGRYYSDIFDLRPTPPKGRENHFLWGKEVTALLNDLYQIHLSYRDKFTVDLLSCQIRQSNYAYNRIAEITLARKEFIKKCEEADYIPPTDD